MNTDDSRRYERVEDSTTEADCDGRILRWGKRHETRADRAEAALAALRAEVRALADRCERRMMATATPGELRALLALSVLTEARDGLLAGTANTTAADPAEVVRLGSDLALARAELAGWEKRYPCEHGCVMVGSPEEDCSRHGRTPGELWTIIRDAYNERDRARSDARAQLQVSSEWVAKYDRAVADLAALRDKVRALADDLPARTHGVDDAGIATWREQDKVSYKIAIEEAQGVIRALLTDGD